MGPVLILNEQLPLIVRPNKTNDPIFEKKSFLKAIEEGKKEINELKLQLSSQLSNQDLQIYDAHIEILGDPELKEKTQQLIEDELYQADFALNQVFKEYASLLKEMDDPYLKERAQDIEMLSRMLTLKIQGKKEKTIELTHPSILVAENLTTNQFAALNSELILAIITAKGGKTDHLAIVAKALGIPTLVGVGDHLKKIRPDSLVILDSQRSMFYIDPDSRVTAEYSQKKKELEEQKQQQFLASSLDAVTKSGKTVNILANVGSFEDAQQAQQCGAEGIGLLRTELCFLDSNHFPDETEQFTTYKKLVSLLPNCSHTIRLVDFGTDKPLPFLPLPKEENPAMGVRALRLGFQYYDQLLKPQIRALLRLHQEFNIKILCPMIASLKDFKQIHHAIEIEYNLMMDQGVKLKSLPPIGIMVEIPNVAFRPDLFVKEVDFFSFGTNDLAQFLMAADRTNDSVLNYLDNAQESLLLLIKHFVLDAHKVGKKVSICGELASDPDCISELIDLGIDSLSVSPAIIPEIKSKIRILD